MVRRCAVWGALAWLAVMLVASGCGNVPLEEVDEVFWDGDGRRVFCATGLDPVSGNDVESVRGGLERAAARDEVLMLFAHTPVEDVPLEKLEAVLSYADELGLKFVTARDLAGRGDEALAGMGGASGGDEDADGEDGGRRGGLHLGFDDSGVDAWFELRVLLAAYDAHVSFYVTRFDLMSESRRDKLRALRADGHSIEAHGLRHLVAPDYVEDYGLAAYMNDEALPSIELLRQDGFDPVAFAYPYGARTGEIDRALLEHVDIVRSVTFTADVPFISDPCPE